MKIMDQIPKWLNLLGAAIMILGAALIGSGYLAKGSDLSAMDVKNQQQYAQSSDLTTLKTDTNKRLDDMQTQMDKRFDRLEDLILNGRFVQHEDRNNK
jgi:hypothetical protein